MTTRRKLQATNRTRSQAGNNREGQSDDLARRLDYLNRTRHNHWDYSALLYLKEIRVHLFVAKEVCRMIYRIVSSLCNESQSTKRIDFSMTAPKLLRQNLLQEKENTQRISTRRKICSKHAN